MKQLCNSFCVAFAMYSKIPMPRVSWEKEDMKYSMCFFPWVGIVIGLGIYGIHALETVWGMDACLCAVLYCIWPLLVTGGIHMDGFLDTMDAIHSYQPKERKLEILKDPHMGAFAFIWGSVYLLLQFGLWSACNPQGLLFPALGFVLSRSISAYAVVSLPLAKKEGLVATFSDASKEKMVKITSLCYIGLVFLGYSLYQWKMALLLGLGLVLFYGYYKGKIKQEFGGITGDLAGYLLQMNELFILVVTVAGGMLWN